MGSFGEMGADKNKNETMIEYEPSRIFVFVLSQFVVERAINMPPGFCLFFPLQILGAIMFILVIEKERGRFSQL